MKRTRTLLEAGSQLQAEEAPKDFSPSEHTRHIKKSRWISPKAPADPRSDGDVVSEATGASHQRDGALLSRGWKARQPYIPTGDTTGLERRLGREDSSMGKVWLTSSKSAWRNRDLLDLWVQEQISRLTDTEARVRVEAVQSIIAELSFLKSNTSTAGDVRDAFVSQLWKEEDTFVLEKLVFNLSLIAAIDAAHSEDNQAKRCWFQSPPAMEQQYSAPRRSPKGTAILGSVANFSERNSRKTEEIDLNKDRSSDLEEEGIDLNHNVQEFERANSTEDISISQVLLNYLSSRRQQMPDIVKLQVLRSLHHMAVNSCCLSWEVIAPTVTKELGSLNPRVRIWGMRLIIETVKRTQVYKEGRGPTDFLIGALEQYMLDAHPGVRETTIASIMSLSASGWKLTKGCYKHLCSCNLEDDFETVRIAAVQLVGMWVKQLISSMQSAPQMKLVDDPFVQVCKRLTDMSFKVRQVACQTLGEMKFVGEAVLLQSLSKRINRDKEAAPDTSMSMPEGSVEGTTGESVSFHFDSSAAGAFVHGLDDEYFEVRAAAIEAMAKLSVGSKKMAQGAVELLVDMLNDDSATVRRQTMQSFLLLAHAGQLAVQEKHLHMFLSVLEETNAEMRKAASALLSAIEFPSISTYQTTIHALLAALDHYPEDSTCILESLTSLGISHGSHTECIAEELVHEMRRILNSDEGLDEPRYPAILALLIAASKERPVILTFLPDHMFAHIDNYIHKLPQSLLIPQVWTLGSKAKQLMWPRQKGQSMKPQYPQESHDRLPMQQVMSSDSSASAVARTSNSSAQGSGSIENPKESPVLDTICRLVQTANDALLLSKSRGLRECLRMIRVCRNDLQCLLSREGDNKDAVKFSMLYVSCISCAAQCHACLSMRSSNMTGSKSLHELGSKFETLVKRMQHCFTGQQRNLQLFMHELNLLVLIWKQASQPTLAVPDSWAAISEEVRGAIAVAEANFAHEELQESKLFRTARELIPDTAADSRGCHSKLRAAARDLMLACWSDMIVGGTGCLETIKEKHAEIRALRSTCENPLSFTAGLPLSIQLDITLHNVSASKENRLWVQFVLENCAPRFTYLDTDENTVKSTEWDDSIYTTRGMERVCRWISTVVNVAHMPSIGACVAKIGIFMECLNDLSSLTHTASRGPREDSFLLPLSAWAEIHLKRNHGP